MNAKELTVVDINTGLGGRALAFSRSGFNVIAVADADNKSLKNASLLLDDNTELIHFDPVIDSIDSIPKADILSLNLNAGNISVKDRRNHGYLQYRKLLSDLICRDAPMAVICQASVMLLRNDELGFLETSISRRYGVWYQVYRENCTGFPLSGSQLYIVLLRNDIQSENSFHFPHVRAEKRNFMPERSAEGINWWYRKVPSRVFIEGEIKVGSLYQINKKRQLEETDTISLNTFNECFYCDELGLRRLTHNEYAILKGYNETNYNETSNHYSMYRNIFSACNLNVFRGITENLKEYFEKSIDVFDDSNWPEFTTDLKNEQQLTNEKKKNKNKKENSQQKFLKQRIYLKNIHIDNLKGLKDLDIPISKNLTAIMGVNGSGKSTILHALACMFEPFSKGQNNKFSFFFTPTPDAMWNGSKFNINYFDGNTQSDTVKKYQKNADRWSPNYKLRPKRDVYFLGIDTCVPEIEKESQSTYISYSTDKADDKLSEKIRKDAAYILDKNYKSLTNNYTKKKNLIGVEISPEVKYTTLSMGAGEQRVVNMLTLAYTIEPFSMILIDEIDLLLHVKALERLIKKLDEIAQSHHLQIIFTTHSIEMWKWKDYVDIKYLYQTKEKTMVFDSITPDIVYDITNQTEIPLTIYVEDDLAEAIVLRVAQDLGISRSVKVKSVGSVQNAFTLASGFVLDGAETHNKLIVLDGDVYCTDEEKKKQIENKLTGTEKQHQEKVDKACSIISQFTLPSQTAPEKFIYDMLIETKENSEIVDCAKQISTVQNSHDWIDEIVRRIGLDRKLALYRIISVVSEHNDWESYVENIRDWLIARREELML